MNNPKNNTPWKTKISVELSDIVNLKCPIQAKAFLFRLKLEEVLYYYFELDLGCHYKKSDYISLIKKHPKLFKAQIETKFELLFDFFNKWCHPQPHDEILTENDLKKHTDKLVVFIEKIFDIQIIIRQEEYIELSTNNELENKTDINQNIDSHIGHPKQIGKIDLYKEQPKQVGMIDKLNPYASNSNLSFIDILKQAFIESWNEAIKIPKNKESNRIKFKKRPW